MSKQITPLFLLFISFLAPGCEDKSICIERVKEDCVCIQIYDPVCGCNNKTYGNSCVAECSGITQYTPGECAKVNTEEKKSKS